MNDGVEPFDDRRVHMRPLGIPILAPSKPRNLVPAGRQKRCELGTNQSTGTGQKYFQLISPYVGAVSIQIARRRLVTIREQAFELTANVAPYQESTER